MSITSVISGEDAAFFPLNKAVAGPVRRPDRPLTAARTLGLLLVAVIILQRFAVPVGPSGTPLVLVIGVITVLLMAISGRLTHDATRTLLFAVATAACGFSAWLTSWFSGSLHINSFLLLVVCYLPWLFRVPELHGRQEGATRIAGIYLKVMLVAALVAIGQMATQLLGLWKYSDPIQSAVPERWLLADYNVANPIQYASPIVKSQAFVFLEPSFLSQFLGLAIIIGILRRAPLWQLITMGLAMFCTYSGTGIVLLAAGLVVILVRSPRKIRLSMVILGAAVVVAILLSPFAGPLVNRTSEVDNGESSLSLRFVLPYQQVADGLADEPVRYLTGAGPGASERVLESAREGGGLAIVYTIIPKLLFEYGILAGSLFLLFLAVTIFRKPPSVVVPAALVIMLTLLSGSLLQPHTLLVAWLLSPVWARE